MHIDERSNEHSISEMMQFGIMFLVFFILFSCFLAYVCFAKDIFRMTGNKIGCWKKQCLNFQKTNKSNPKFPICFS